MTDAEIASLEATARRWAEETEDTVPSASTGREFLDLIAEVRQMRSIARLGAFLARDRNGNFELYLGDMSGARMVSRMTRDEACTLLLSTAQLLDADVYLQHLETCKVDEYENERSGGRVKPCTCGFHEAIGKEP